MCVSRDERVNQTYPIRLLFSSFIGLAVNFYGLNLLSTYESFEINTISQQLFFIVNDTQYRQKCTKLQSKRIRNPLAAEDR